MSDDETEVQQLGDQLSTIKQHFDREEYELALPLCVKACEMKSAPQAQVVMARRCRVFALLSLSRWAEALQFCEKNTSGQDSFGFERAYCLYRLNRFQKALDALATAAKEQDDDAGRRMRLEAQIRYRMGDYEASAKTFAKLKEEDPDDVGLLANAVAARVSENKTRDALQMMAGQEETLESSFELFFNLACALIDEERATKGTGGNVKAFLADQPGACDVLLPLAQMYAQQHRYESAVEVLSQLPVRRRAQPQTVEAIVALHQKQKSPEKALACVRDAMNYWASEGGDADEGTFASVLRIAARLAKEAKDKQFLAEVFQLHLEKVDGSDAEALSGLVQALAMTDVERAEQYAQRLRIPDYDHFDPEELEAAPIPKIGLPPKKKDKEQEEEKGETDDKTEATPAKKTRKRHRKPLYPKGFDPENPGPPPDPERWLPKRERAEFKKRMKKRDKNLARGPQGSMPTDDNAFRKQGPSTAQVEVAKDGPARASRNQGRKKQGKK